MYLLEVVLFINGLINGVRSNSLSAVHEIGIFTVSGSTHCGDSSKQTVVKWRLKTPNSTVMSANIGRLLERTIKK